MYFITFAKLFNKNLKVHYIVIGGWLSNYIKRKPFLKIFVKSFYKIYVETNSMILNLKELGIENTIIFPNFKNINIISKEEIYFVNDLKYLLNNKELIKEYGNNNYKLAKMCFDREKNNIKIHDFIIK